MKRRPNILWPIAIAALLWRRDIILEAGSIGIEREWWTPGKPPALWVILETAQVVNEDPSSLRAAR